MEGRARAKPAILKYVKSKVAHSVEIDPTELAMSYVSNSDVLRFLQAIGADLELTFQVLWKHVICIEFIRLRFNVENESASQSVFAKIAERFRRDDRKQRSLNVDPFEYMVERTLMRPRDIIAFVNECLRPAQGKYEVPATIIKQAEIEFSRIRREALEQEWQSAFPSIKKLLDFLGTRRSRIFRRPLPRTM
ncbi:hypothetical protein IVB18_13640 [Bradyrhizobium sp. 186]|uniref:hypothetical protein n=1 Tax=Bradyrhizobium sp. 186 TaxID=2782654 RepID=UPI0020007618|nr:hypothetical protein [Bradyrhizobium sp. 186]UPK38207.1 hypothetical protein IVB18_13640 [Bradyrhizobium sp. 186]